jgi:hypothetical protein
MYFNVAECAANHWTVQAVYTFGDIALSGGPLERVRNLDVVNHDGLSG